MIDLKRLAEDSDYRNGIERKRVRAGLLDELLEVVAAERQANASVQELRTRQNAASKDIGRAPAEERQAKILVAATLKQELAAAELHLATIQPKVRELALQVPNPAHDSVPDGGEDEGTVVRSVGAQDDPPALDHADFAASMRWVDRERAAEIAGSRFSYLMGDAVMLEFAIVQWVLSKLVVEGFTPVIPPVLVRESTMEEAGFFPTDRAQVYDVDNGELFLVGTAEVPLSVLHRNETLNVAGLPLRYAGFSSCFRREAGTYGKDTRGIFRVHQFDKVEMFVFADPATSWEEHERILAIEESIIGGLGLPYRVVNIAAADLGNAAAKKYDLEVWLPSERQYREVTSCSNYLDYSARRLGTRTKTSDGASQHVHTLNGTACAISRTLAFIFEHYQDGIGGFNIPDVLRPWMGKDHIAPLS